MSDRHIFVTGMPRAGTSMMLYMIRSLLGQPTPGTVETHPAVFLQRLSKHTVRQAIKQPLGYYETFSPVYRLADVCDVFDVVCMYRNPADVLVSFHARRKNYPWVALQVVMRALEDICYEMTKGNKSITFVSYEGLVEKPEETMKVVCARLGIQYHKKCLSFWEALPQKAREPLNRARSIDKNSIGRWEDDDNSSITFTNKEFIRHIATDRLGELTEMLKHHHSGGNGELRPDLLDSGFDRQAEYRKYQMLRREYGDFAGTEKVKAECAGNSRLGMEGQDGRGNASQT